MADRVEEIRARLAAVTDARDPYMLSDAIAEMHAHAEGDVEHLLSALDAANARPMIDAALINDEAVRALGEAEAERDRLRDDLAAEREAHAKTRAERDCYLAAIEAIAPDGLGFQLVLGDDQPGAHMPMYGRVELVSPPIIATEPLGDDDAFAGARAVHVWTYDEDSQHEAEFCGIGFFVTEEWLCERDEKAEAELDAWKARAENAEAHELSSTRRAEAAEADLHRAVGAAVLARLHDAANDDGMLLVDTVTRLRDAFTSDAGAFVLENVAEDGDVWAVFDAVLEVLTKPNPSEKTS